MRNSALLIIILAGCPKDVENSTEITTAQILATPTSVSVPQQATTRPVRNQTLQHSVTLTQEQTSKSVYKCTLPNGTTVYTDTQCNSPTKIITIEKFHTNTSPLVVASPPPQAVSTSKQQTVSDAYQKPSNYEINTRYDNLTREIKSIFDSGDKVHINQALLVLEQDRTNALSMRAEIKQSHDIHTRFDNLAREARAHNKSTNLVYQLLNIEQMRNEALYRNDVSL